jgi:hypothetical protein
MVASLRGRELGSRGKSTVRRVNKENSEERDREDLSLCYSDL